jgi:type IV secretion/conjugal transfer VirB4 family ATPase
MIRLSRIVRDYQDAGALNALVNVQAAVDEHTFATKSGHVLTVLRASGVDFECLDPSQLDQIARRFESSLRIFDEHFRVYQYLLKRDHAIIPARDYANPILQEAITSRIADLKARSAALYTLDIYWVIVYEGWRPARGLRQMLSRMTARPRAASREALSTETKITALEDGLERACETLTNKVASFVVQLEDVVPLERLDKQAAHGFLRRLLNYAPYKSDTGQLKYDEFVDFQICDSALECHRDHLELDDYHVRVLTLKEPPAQTFAHLLRGLQGISTNFILASEWKRESQLTIRQLIQSKRRHFYNAKSSLANYLTTNGQTAPKDMLVDDGAVAVVAELGGCLEELEVRGRSFGQFSLTLVLYDRDPAALRRSVAECLKVFATHDARLTEERYNLLNAWLAVIPGNSAHNLRRLWLLDRNYADLSFLYGPRAGEPVNAHLSAEYLAVFESEGGTPYFLNLHYQDCAHSLVLGATGSGKSFLLNFLITQLQKYDPFTFIFDLGGGYAHLTRLFGGAYLAVGAQEQPAAINPFCLPPTRENLHFLFAFCRVLIESAGYTLTASDERDLAEQIENVYAVEPEQRRLLTLASIVNRTLRLHLHKWVEGGAYGRWFDNVTDTLTLARFQAFDFEGMDKVPEVLEPLVFYILHRANAAIYDLDQAATLKVFVLDEAWRFFRHPAVRRYIVEALKTWRKKNAAMILATQSVDDLRQSEILPVVVESCVTKLFLANPGMDRDTYREIFHLNATEAERIAQLVPKRQILVKKPDLAKVVNLNVDRRSYWLYTNTPYDNQQRTDAFTKYGFEHGLEELTRRNPA